MPKRDYLGNVLREKTVEELNAEFDTNVQKISALQLDNVTIKVLMNQFRDNHSYNIENAMNRQGYTLDQIQQHQSYLENTILSQ